MKKLCLLVLFFPFLAIAQSNKGIKWTTGLSWDQIFAKAKAENKYIFVDCFATWCGPCKMMDKEVYPNNSIGKLFNEKFISVKVQMDKTKNDNAIVQSWYNDAASVRERYLLSGYPTFLFFTPKGIIIHKESGFKEVEKFLSIANTALTPGRVFKDEYPEYKEFVKDFNRGEVDYGKIPVMVAIAKKLGDTTNSRSMVRLHEDYVFGLPVEQRYTEENIKFWSTLNLNVDRKIMQFFLEDGNRIDAIMKAKGYAAWVFDKAVARQILVSFYKEQNKNPKIGVEGMYVGGRELQPYYTEADWEKLEKMLSQKFNKQTVKRNVLAARIEWYKRHYNTEASVKYQLIQFQAFPPDVKVRGRTINNIGWAAFKGVNDRELLKKSIKYVKKEVKRTKENYESREEYSMLVDTYANLLYKTGNTELAIRWQEKAVGLFPDEKEHQEALDQMKKGEPTYGVKPLKSMTLN